MGQRLSVILLLTAVAVVLVLLIHKLGVLQPEKLRSFIQSTGNWGPIVLMLVIVIGTTTFMLPGTLAIVIASVLYGVLLGSLYAFIALVISASIMFFIARYFRRFILARIGSHADTFEQFQEKHVTLVIFFARLLPVFNFEMISYASGITSIRYKHYIAATAAGLLVPLALYSTSANLLLHEESVWLSMVMVVGLILVFFIVPIALDHYNPWRWKQKLLNKKKATHRR